jgi:hypothetical protein
MPQPKYETIYTGSRGARYIACVNFNKCGRRIYIPNHRTTEEALKKRSKCHDCGTKINKKEDSTRPRIKLTQKQRAKRYDAFENAYRTGSSTIFKYMCEFVFDGKVSAKTLARALKNGSISRAERIWNDAQGENK